MVCNSLFCANNNFFGCEVFFLIDNMWKVSLRISRNHFESGFDEFKLEI